MLTERTLTLNSSDEDPLGSKSPPSPAMVIFTKLLTLTHQLDALNSLLSLKKRKANSPEINKAKRL